jgi:nucleoid-associated protein YgaU
MRNEARLWVVLGVVLAAAAIFYFANLPSNSSDEQAHYESPTTGTPPRVVGAEQMPRPQPDENLEPASETRQEPASVHGITPDLALAPEPIPQAELEPDMKSEPDPNPAPELEQKPAPVSDVTPSPALAPEPVPQADPDDTNPRYYTVEKGDTLYRISKLVYGEGKYWRAIYQANKSLITDPRALQPGWELKLPRPEEFSE